jgi:hypothetical protein
VEHHPATQNVSILERGTLLTTLTSPSLLSFQPKTHHVYYLWVQHQSSTLPLVTIQQSALLFDASPEKPIQHVYDKLYAKLGPLYRGGLVYLRLLQSLAHSLLLQLKFQPDRNPSNLAKLITTEFELELTPTHVQILSQIATYVEEDVVQIEEGTVDSTCKISNAPGPHADDQGDLQRRRRMLRHRMMRRLGGRRHEEMGRDWPEWQQQELQEQEWLQQPQQMMVNRRNVADPRFGAERPAGEGQPPMAANFDFNMFAAAAPPAQRFGVLHHDPPQRGDDPRHLRHLDLFEGHARRLGVERPAYEVEPLMNANIQFMFGAPRAPEPAGGVPQQDPAGGMFEFFQEFDLGALAAAQRMERSQQEAINMHDEMDDDEDVFGIL